MKKAISLALASVLLIGCNTKAECTQVTYVPSPTIQQYEKATLAYLVERPDVAITDIDCNSSGECFLWFDVDKPNLSPIPADWVCMVDTDLTVTCGFPAPGDDDY